LEEAPWARKYLAAISPRSSAASKRPCAFCCCERGWLPITADEGIDAIGSTSFRAILEVSETTANDIEQAGQAAVEIAAELLKEAQELAAQLRETGNKMGAHLQEFATLARKVSTAMRNTGSSAS
jgi:hypothetical protein